MANITKGGISTTEYILPSDEKKTKDFLPVHPKWLFWDRRLQTINVSG